MSTLRNRRGENSVQQKKGEHRPSLSSQHANCSIRFKDMKCCFVGQKELNISNFLWFGHKKYNKEYSIFPV